MRLKKMAWLQGAFGLTLFAGPVFVAVASFAAYTGADNNLTTANAFTALALFTVLRFPMGFLPSVILAVVNVLVALKRIAAFLASSEVGSNQEWFSTDVPAGHVKITDGSFQWSEEDSRGMTLRGINLECAPGSMTMVVGAVGSGKSSLLATLFRQISRKSGSVAIGGRIALVPQTAWIINETLRNNVLMGSPMHADRCALSACLLTTMQCRCTVEIDIGSQAARSAGTRRR